MISYRIGFSECEHRRASNRQHARKPIVYRVSAGLPRAKFRPDRRPPRPLIWARNGPKISLAGSVTLGPPPSSWAQEVPMRRLIAAILAIPTLFNGLAMLAAGPF